MPIIIELLDDEAKSDSFLVLCSVLFVSSVDYLCLPFAAKAYKVVLECLKY